MQGARVDRGGAVQQEAMGDAILVDQLKTPLLDESHDAAEPGGRD
jgi:hypothetical protein